MVGKKILVFENRRVPKGNISHSTLLCSAINGESFGQRHGYHAKRHFLSVYFFSDALDGQMSAMAAARFITCCGALLLDPQPVAGNTLHWTIP